jgi:hypothetical protein
MNDDVLKLLDLLKDGGWKNPYLYLSIFAILFSSNFYVAINWLHKFTETIVTTFSKPNVYGVLSNLDFNLENKSVAGSVIEEIRELVNELDRFKSRRVQYLLPFMLGYRLDKSREYLCNIIYFVQKFSAQDLASLHLEIKGLCSSLKIDPKSIGR